ncbi:DUF5684 domain-containing protein [Lentzea flava]|uniref:Signal peptidase I n=1 Tax=Lentzea flava TaxID=103732 RepID=A0ABQ2V0P4_9PSEU|nr:DUF5684 domain-containing protein [Lentzea flava]MCP2202856.1 GlyGly-CTERM domain-containing protein [Lentzea flava]GGU62686.1 hypothetical protein GCM10010178_63430 [Lentzea flava]
MYEDSGSSTGSLIFSLVFAVIVIAGMWATFAKAGKPGWAAIIPIYNLYVLLKVAGRPGWWLILFIIPLVNFIMSIIVAIDVAKSFGKGGAFGFFLLALLPFIGYPVLGFGSAQYRGPAAGQA